MSFTPFLFFLFLIPIPIIIHFISQRNLEVEDFPTLVFLVKSESRLMRWLRLKRWILLFLRIAVIVSIVLAGVNLLIPFSFFDPAELYLRDNSPSMNRFENVRKGAILIPNEGGIPDISRIVEKYRIGTIVSDGQGNGFREIIRRGGFYPGIDLERKSLPSGNLGIIDFEKGPSFTSRPLHLQFTVLNEYDKEKIVESELKIDGRVVEKREITIDPGVNTVKFSVSPEEGLHEGKLTIEDREGFNFDNTHNFALNVMNPVEVTLISTEKPERTAAALNRDYFNVQWNRDWENVAGDLFIFLGNDSVLSEAEVPEDKPGILCVENCSGFDSMEVTDEKLSTPLEIKGISGFNKLYSMDKIPLKYNCVLKGERIILYFSNGDPFIMKSGKHFYLPVSFENSDLSLHPVFIPFLYSLVNTALEEIPIYNVTVNEEVSFRSGERPVIQRPSGRKDVLSDGEDSVYIYTRADSTGIYRVTASGVERGVIVVNHNPEESRLKQISEDELSEIFGPPDRFNGSSFFLVLALLFSVVSGLIEQK